MLNVIRNIKVYSPEYLGKKDLLFVYDKIEGLYDSFKASNSCIDVNEIDGTDKILLPGFIDSHVHLLGGGGEGGYATRTSELCFDELAKAGITTVVGCLGTDGVSRNLISLLAKCKELEALGLNTFMYTGSYRIPISTITGNIQSDLMLVDKIIGAGEIAISDHRSSEPTFEELARCIADTRVAGILTDKAGVCNIHIGAGKRMLNLLYDILEKTDIPSKNILPTHLNRNKTLLMEGINYVKKGGYIDLTTSTDIKHLEKDEVLAGEGLKIYLDKDLPIENITFSSDGNGSLPIFDDNGILIEVGKGSVSSLYEEVKKSILKYKISIEKAIKVITSNPSDRLKLKNKGYIKQGYDADFVIVNNKDLSIETVYSRGKIINKY